MFDKLLQANFKFHPVGQGCFYSGYIECKRIPFNMVYDCGTVSPRNFLTNEINKYKASLKGDLDVLIISHFDEDHINGVFELLKGIICKNLIIPYYEPIERLLLAVEFDNDGSGGNDDYIEFLRNPVTYFLENEYNIERIIIVGRPNEESDKLPDPDNIAPDPEFDNIKGFILDADFYAGYNDIEIAEADRESTSNPKVKFLKKPYRIQIPYWEFVFYLKQFDNKLLIQKVTDEINGLVKRNRITILDLFDFDYLKDLKEIYEKKFNDLNNTSLVTYHGPTNNNFIYWPKYYWVHCNEKNGTLLTGDISLKSKKSIQNLKNYYSRYMERICFFQLPHHGAKANWNFTRSNELPQFCVYIINHGLGRNHHPSLEVIEYVKVNYSDAVIKLSNEAENFNYSFF